MFYLDMDMKRPDSRDARTVGLRDKQALRRIIKVPGEKVLGQNEITWYRSVANEWCINKRVSLDIKSS